MSIIIRQQKCYEKYDSVDIANTIVKRSFSKHLCLADVILKKSYIFQKNIFKKMPPGNPKKPNPGLFEGNIIRGQRIS